MAKKYVFDEAFAKDYLDKGREGLREKVGIKRPVLYYIITRSLVEGGNKGLDYPDLTMVLSRDVGRMVGKGLAWVSVTLQGKVKDEALPLWLSTFDFELELVEGRFRAKFLRIKDEVSDFFNIYYLEEEHRAFFKGAAEGIDSFKAAEHVLAEEEWAWLSRDLLQEHREELAYAHSFIKLMKSLYGLKFIKKVIEFARLHGFNIIENVVDYIPNPESETMIAFSMVYPKARLWKYDSFIFKGLWFERKVADYLTQVCCVPVLSIKVDEKGRLKDVKVVEWPEVKSGLSCLARK